MTEEKIISFWRSLANHGDILEMVEDQNYDGLLIGLVLHLKGVGRLTDQELMRLVALYEMRDYESL